MDENLTCPRCAATAAITAAKCPECAYEFGPNTRQEGERKPRPPMADEPPLPEPLIMPPVKTEPNFSQDAPLVPVPPYTPRNPMEEARFAGCLVVVVLSVAAFAAWMAPFALCSR